MKMRKKSDFSEVSPLLSMLLVSSSFSRKLHFDLLGPLNAELKAWLELSG